MSTAQTEPRRSQDGGAPPGTPTEGVPVRRPRRLDGRGAALVGIEIVSPVAVLVGLMLWTEQADNYVFPPLAPILVDFPQTWFVDRFTSDVLPSLQRLGLGLALATTIAVPSGFLLGQSVRVRAVVSPLLELFRAIPAPALIPLVILLLGLGDDAKVVLIASVCTWPILLNTIDGVAGLEPAYHQTATVFRVGSWQRQRHVVLPGALPRILAGLRVAVALALIMVVVSEMAASQNGIGFTVLLAQRNFDLSTMWSGILLLGMLGYLLNLLFLRLERHVLAWHRGSRTRAE